MIPMALSNRILRLEPWRGPVLTESEVAAVSAVRHFNNLTRSRWVVRFFAVVKSEGAMLEGIAQGSLRPILQDAMAESHDNAGTDPVDDDGGEEDPAAGKERGGDVEAGVVAVKEVAGVLCDEGVDRGALVADDELGELVKLDEGGDDGDDEDVEGGPGVEHLGGDEHGALEPWLEGHGPEDKEGEELDNGEEHGEHKEDDLEEDHAGIIVDAAGG
eukprot:CAMPEP_0117060642 /NCGR_PEP_ID=MMETSP0472-20121206/42173_1 /TAXON_ID=693140 ORGANISM="Tiarina fusus, Strain LIS" /NCGR_SAMPLE_ID=MMETSP0472 /ASSEMBLY_ACC=CAM_ASM_000603 /LENGTH=215 /DNA_ID=CAMNT_0004778917 /DNA_START=102 /DNA_END=744 /DNA_ORIENTATION=+